MYLKLNQFNKIFELNYNDLFREINGKIYFLVFFTSTSQNYFEIGKIYTNKYSLIPLEGNNGGSKVNLKFQISYFLLILYF